MQNLISWVDWPAGSIVEIKLIEWQHFFFKRKQKQKQKQNCTRLVSILMMTPHQVSLKNIEILNKIFFSILVETFIQVCLYCLIMLEPSICKSCLVSALDINSADIQKLVTSTVLLGDHAVSLQ